MAGGTLVVAFVDFSGVNIPMMADFSDVRSLNSELGRDAHSQGAPAGCSTPLLEDISNVFSRTKLGWPLS